MPVLVANVAGAAKQICSDFTGLPNALIAAFVYVAVIVLSRSAVSANSYQSADAGV